MANLDHLRPLRKGTQTFVSALRVTKGSIARRSLSRKPVQDACPRVLIAQMVFRVNANNEKGPGCYCLPGSYSLENVGDNP